MKDSCYYCKYNESVGYGQWVYDRCQIIGCEIKSPTRTICDKYEIAENFKCEKKKDELKEKFNFRNIK